MSETYLGDGLYVSSDGYQIKLRAPRMGGDHEIFLEPDVLKSFLDYVDKLNSPEVTFEEALIAKLACELALPMEKKDA